MKLPPGTNQGDEAPPNPKVLAVLLEKIEAMVTDAASDELKAGKLLTGQDPSKHVPPSLRNVKFHCRELSCPPAPLTHPLRPNPHAHQPARILNFFLT